MRLYHFTIMFAIIALLMLVMLFLDVEESLAGNTDTELYDRVFDNAINSAVNIISEAGQSGIYGVRDNAVDTFYEALASSLGITGVTPAITNLRLHIPIILITDGENAYVCYDDYLTNKDGNEKLARCWSKCIRFGQDDMQNSFEGLHFSNIEECLQYYCDYHNEVAQRSGITYRFTLPEADGGMFIRGSAGWGMYALLQGYRIEGVTHEYTRSSFAGAGIQQKEYFYINLEGTGLSSNMYFHREGCTYLSENSVRYDSRRECALHGAYECIACKRNVR